MNENTYKQLIAFMLAVHGIKEADLVANFSTDDEMAAKISEVKTEVTENFKSGLADGKKAAKAIVLKKLATELGIEIPTVDSIEDIALTVKPLIEAKFKQEVDPKTETEAMKQMRKDHEAQLTKIATENEEKVKEAAKNTVETQTRLEKQAIARNLLNDGGFIVPKEQGEKDMKFDMAMGFINSKGYEYEYDETDKKYYRIGSDNIRVRDANNKPLTFENDLESVFNVSFGKAPANQKDAAAFPDNKQRGTDFDFSSLVNKEFGQPKTLDEALSLSLNKSLDVKDRAIFRQYAEKLEAEQSEKSKAA